MSEGLSPFTEPEREGEEAGRDRDRRDRRVEWHPSKWIAGIVLIIFGVLFLLQNLDIEVPAVDNWWALFILIPAIGAFIGAWNSYQEVGGRLTYAVRWGVVSGLILTMVALTFLLNLNWGLIWPIVLIVIGLAALIGGFVGR